MCQQRSLFPIAATMLFVLLSVTTLNPTLAFLPTFQQDNSKAPKIMEDRAFLAPDTADILEEACKDTAQRMKRAKVPVSPTICPDGEVGISFVHWPALKRSNLPPIVLVHGFDSSCLEYRRLGSRLAQLGIDAYAVDILGWGFTQLENVEDFSAQAKVEALNSFVNKVIGSNTPFCVAGASLGGAAAIELASSNSNCEGLILIDAQGFVDGVGPLASLPKFLAQVGVAVLKSIPLRNSANQMSYFDKGTFATDDALNIGRLHCIQQPQWSDAMVNFMGSGGFTPSAQIPTIQAPALVLWGRQDRILDGNEFANKFVETLPNAELQWIEDCGHVPHLEQPGVTAKFISEFLSSRVVPSLSGNKKIENPFAEAASKLFQLN